MNGVQFGRGASGSISGIERERQRVQSPVSCGIRSCHQHAIGGILVFDSLTSGTPTVSVTNNTVTGNDIGIYSDQLSGTSTISGNIGEPRTATRASTSTRAPRTSRTITITSDGRCRRDRGAGRLRLPGRCERDRDREHDQREPDRRRGPRLVPGCRMPGPAAAARHAEHHRRVHRSPHRAAQLDRGEHDARRRQRDAVGAVLVDGERGVQLVGSCERAGAGRARFRRSHHCWCDHRGHMAGHEQPRRTVRDRCRGRR